VARNGYFVVCGICGSLGHSARNCALAAIELRKDPFGEQRRIREARERRRSRGAVSSAEPAAAMVPMLSGARRT